VVGPVGQLADQVHNEWLTNKRHRSFVHSSIIFAANLTPARVPENRSVPRRHCMQHVPYRTLYMHFDVGAFRWPLVALDNQSTRKSTNSATWIPQERHNTLASYGTELCSSFAPDALRCRAATCGAAHVLRYLNVFSARCNILYISRLCYDVSVRLSVRLSVTDVHWRIIANLGFKFRSHFTAHCGRLLLAGAVLLAVLLACGSSRAMLASARLSCFNSSSLSSSDFYQIKSNSFLLRSLEIDRTNISASAQIGLICSKSPRKLKLI